MSPSVGIVFIDTLPGKAPTRILGGPKHLLAAVLAQGLLVVADQMATQLGPTMHGP